MSGFPYRVGFQGGVGVPLLVQQIAESMGLHGRLSLMGGSAPDWRLRKMD